mgnify:CR=1 FL=1
MYSTPILPFFFIFQHVKIREVSALCYVVFFHCFQNCASWFMGMCAVVEAAIFGEVEYLLEVACELFRFDIECAEAFYSWSVDYVSSFWQFKHLTECCGVSASIMGVAYLCRLQLYVRQQTVDKCRFANAAVAAEHGSFSCQ